MGYIWIFINIFLGRTARWVDIHRHRFGSNSQMGEAGRTVEGRKGSSSACHCLMGQTSRRLLEDDVTCDRALCEVSAAWEEAGRGAIEGAGLECVPVCVYRGYESRRSGLGRTPYNPVDARNPAGEHAGGRACGRAKRGGGRNHPLYIEFH